MNAPTHNIPFVKSDFTKNLKDIQKKFPQDVMKALYQEGQALVTVMKERCPVDTTPQAPHPGNLRASIHAELPERRGQSLIQLFATGVQAPYAIYVHEDPDAHHPIGGWKFMENPLKEAAPGLSEKIAARVTFNQYKNTAEFMAANH